MDSNFWNDIYSEKHEQEVSWFQEVPVKSIELIEDLNLPQDSSVIDVGGGESRLADYFLSRGIREISILDISSVALEKLKERLGKSGKKINYIVTDITEFKPIKKFNLWHDRATFHFLTSLIQVDAYLKIAYEALEQEGYLIISTFSKTGPDKCSGLPISKYSDEELKDIFGRYFENIKCLEDAHITPWGTQQDFVYCGFKKT